MTVRLSPQDIDRLCTEQEEREKPGGYNMGRDYPFGRQVVTHNNWNHRHGRQPTLEDIERRPPAKTKGRHRLRS